MATFLEGGFVNEFFDSLSRPLVAVNCSTIVGNMELGSRQPDGTYSGLLGRMIKGVCHGI